MYEYCLLMTTIINILKSIPENEKMKKNENRKIRKNPKITHKKLTKQANNRELSIRRM